MIRRKIKDDLTPWLEMALLPVKGAACTEGIPELIDIPGCQAHWPANLPFMIVRALAVEVLLKDVSRIRFQPNEAEAHLINRLSNQMIRDKLLEAALRRRHGEVFSITPKTENKALHLYDVMMTNMLDILFVELGDGSMRRDKMRRVIESII